MNYFLLNKNELVAIVTESPYTGTPALKDFGFEYDKVVDFWYYKTFDEAAALADEATKLTGNLHLATDTPSCTPRFKVVQAPKVGDLVSYGFNGDYYPDGQIVSVTKTLQVKTSTGSTYRRRKLTGSWQKPGGTWSMVQGHINERNPHF